MCIAILKPKGQTLDLADLEECWDNNPHGAGLMFAHEGKLIVRKGWMKWRNFRRAWLKHDLTDKTVALHFRISTGGNIDQANCHPHLINAESGVVHNGIFTSKNIPIRDKNYSDTCHFVWYLRDLGDPEFLKDPATRKWISKVCAGSKLIFMRANGTHEIINGASGDWHDGSWFSNTTYKFPMFYESAYEPWQRNPQTGTWEQSGLDLETTCSMCDLPLYLAAERACDICEVCITAMYEDVRQESDKVYSESYPVEQTQIARRIHEEENFSQEWKAHQVAKRIHEENIGQEWEAHQEAKQKGISDEEYMLITEKALEQEKKDAELIASAKQEAKALRKTKQEKLRQELRSIENEDVIAAAKPKNRAAVAKALITAAKAVW